MKMDTTGDTLIRVHKSGSNDFFGIWSRLFRFIPEKPKDRRQVQVQTHIPKNMHYFISLGDYLVLQNISNMGIIIFRNSIWGLPDACRQQAQEELGAVGLSTLN